MDSSISRERLREIRDMKTLFIQPQTPKTTLTDFHLFPQLPFDLRLLIWELVSKVPRVVVVDVFAKTGDEFEGGAKRCATPTPVPSVLHVCTESRNIALRPGKYELAFAWREPGDGNDSSNESLGIPPSIYFNFAVDTLYFRCLHNLPAVSHRTALSRLAIVKFGNHISLSQIQRIRSVAMDVGAKNAEIAVEHLLQKTRGGGRWGALSSVALVLDERNGSLIMRGGVEFLQLKKYPTIYTRIFPFASVDWGVEVVGKVKARERGEFIGFRELRKLMKRRCQDQDVVMKALADCLIEEVIVIRED